MEKFSYTGNPLTKFLLWRRAAHRLALHRDKLFYCDVCSPYEKGSTNAVKIVKGKGGGGGGGDVVLIAKNMCVFVKQLD